MQQGGEGEHGYMVQQWEGLLSPAAVGALAQHAGGCGSSWCGPWALVQPKGHSAPKHLAQSCPASKSQSGLLYLPLHKEKNFYFRSTQRIIATSFLKIISFINAPNSFINILQICRWTYMVGKCLQKILDTSSAFHFASKTFVVLQILNKI